MDVDKVATLFKEAGKLLREQPPPLVNPDRKQKKISVTYGFALGLIPVKLRATYQEWLNLWGGLDPDRLELNDIRPSLSRPSRETLERLRICANKEPTFFALDVMTCVESANHHNPLYRPARKPRGERPYGLTWHEMNGVRASAVHLYVYLDHMRKKPANERPTFLRKMFKDCDVLPIELETALPDAVCKIIGHYFNFAPNPDRFYKTFIQESGVSLKRLRSLKRTVTEDNPFLTPIFRKFSS